jgi:hypothetical protein
MVPGPRLLQPASATNRKTVEKDLAKWVIMSLSEKDEGI